jgi:integrase
MRVIILVAAVTGLRQSELLGLRWKHVDFNNQRIRVRNAWVRGEHSDEGKSELSTERSTAVEDLAFAALAVWKKRTAYAAPNDLVFAHPQTGKPLDRTKVTRKFQQACRDAGVPVVRFHDLRHTFGTHMAAAGTPLRIIQEMMGHADAKTTQIYSHYAPSPHEVDMVNKAFRRPALGPREPGGRPEPTPDARLAQPLDKEPAPVPRTGSGASDESNLLQRELEEEVVVL